MSDLIWVQTVCKGYQQTSRYLQTNSQEALFFCFRFGTSSVLELWIVMKNTSSVLELWIVMKNRSSVLELWIVMKNTSSVLELWIVMKNTDGQTL